MSLQVEMDACEGGKLDFKQCEDSIAFAIDMKVQGNEELGSPSPDIAIVTLSIGDIVRLSHALQAIMHSEIEIDGYFRAQEEGLHE